MTMAEASSSRVIGASRSIYYSLTDEVPGLTDEEKNKLESVMKKALEFEAEEENKMRQPLEGQLYKYTNVVKGWQYRWFVISPETGMLEYYMLDERNKKRPRGALYLNAGAVVSPSEEDNQSFVVSDAWGEVFKLKAADAKERQIWVDKIRSVVEKHASDSSEVAKRDTQTGVQNAFALCKNSLSNVSEVTRQISASNSSSGKLTEAGSENLSSIQTDTTNEIKESVYKALKCQKALTKSIEILPSSGPHLKCSDNKLLLIKAISQATVQSLEQCYLILKRHRDREVLKSTALSIAPSVDSFEKLKGSYVKKD